MRSRASSEVRGLLAFCLDHGLIDDYVLEEGAINLRVGTVSRKLSTGQAKAYLLWILEEAKVVPPVTPFFTRPPEERTAFEGEVGSGPSP
jgi:hypothetical protein